MIRLIIDDIFIVNLFEDIIINIVFYNLAKLKKMTHFKHYYKIHF